MSDFFGRGSHAKLRICIYVDSGQIICQVRAGRERVRLMSFSRPELETALHEIAAKADIRRFPGADLTPVNTTGIGSNEYAQKIEETLKVT